MLFLFSRFAYSSHTRQKMPLAPASYEKQRVPVPVSLQAWAAPAPEADVSGMEPQNLSHRQACYTPTLQRAAPISSDPATISYLLGFVLLGQQGLDPGPSSRQRPFPACGLLLMGGSPQKYSYLRQHSIGVLYPNWIVSIYSLLF